MNNKLGKSFAFLNTTQLLGALNDNTFKLLLIMFLIGGKDSLQASRTSALAGVLFVIPFLLFSALGGKLADRYSKRDIVVCTKFVEIGVMLLGFTAFYFDNTIALYATLFLMATQSSIFGPSKYGILPELVEDHQLSKANSFIEGCTYLAIVLGMTAATLLSQITQRKYDMATIFCIALSLVGFAVSLAIKRTKPVGNVQKASIFFVRDIWRTIRGISDDKALLSVVIASAYFMFIGGFIQITIIPYGIEVLGFSEIQAGYLFLFTAIGIGVGSFLAGKLSGRNVEFGIIPLGAIGLMVTSLLLALCPAIEVAENLAATMSTNIEMARPAVIYFVYAVLFFMGMSAGLFIVPIHAFIQLRSPNDRRGQILAASGFLGWVGVLIAGGIVFALSLIPNYSQKYSYVILAVLTLALTVATVKVLPDFLTRFIFVMLTRLCYRIKAINPENIPMESGALLVSNHVSWADAVLISATQQRRVRFMMDRDIYNGWLNPLFRLMQVIPISATDPPKKIVQSLRDARTALDEGYLVCIFAEGTITRNGMMRAFKGGFERIVKKTEYPIIPMYIGGAWGSILSYYYGNILKTMPKKFPYPVSIHFGEPMPSDSTSDEVKVKVMELSCQYHDSLKEKKSSLGHTFAKMARKHWTKHAISDPTGKRLTFGKTLTAAVAIGAKIEKQTQQRENVGLLLPPSVGGALANLAVTLYDRVAVNLNYTVSQESREYAIDQCEIKTVISSRKFIEKIGISPDMKGLVFLEDITEQITGGEKLSAFLKARFIPARHLAHARKFNPDDTATIIFSSGSSGTPKGIMLSHHNILSNVEAARMVIHIRPNDHMCSLPPFFHSLGFMASLWLPMLSGIAAHFVPNPLDGKLVGKGARENKSTILFTPPTFLMNYLRRVEPEDFADLRLVITGAEKLKKRLADSFEKKFAIRPMEGYGATELSPVASLNVPDVEVGGIHQIGNKEGSVGKALPGVAIKIVDIESGKMLPAGEEGLMMVKGPNLMNGYLNNKEATDEVICDGWYNTGDVAIVDSEGFITLTDRLSRFSKIAGEMVPHGAVEEILLKGVNAHEHIVSVTSIPDAKKGEQLIVLYMDEAGTPEKLHQIVTESTLPNIFRPRKENYYKIDSMPLLGSGKLDLRTIRQFAMDASSEKNKDEA